VTVATQREDPVPRGLYPKRERAKLQLLKIPACADCNSTKSRVDNALRDFLVIDLDSSAHAVAQEVFREKMASAVSGNHVRLIDDFYNGEHAPIFNREGNFDGTAYAIPADFVPVYEAVNWLTRGLHWAAFGVSIDAASTKVSLVDRYKRLDVVVKLATLGWTDVFEQGDPFKVSWLVAPSGTVYWAHVFFGSVLFFCRTQLAPIAPDEAVGSVPHE